MTAGDLRTLVPPHKRLLARDPHLEYVQSPFLFEEDLLSSSGILDVTVVFIENHFAACGHDLGVRDLGVQPPVAPFFTNGFESLGAFMGNEAPVRHLEVPFG